MSKNISEATKQGRLESLTYGAGAQFEPHSYNYATSKDLERELRRDDTRSGQPSVATKARREPRNEEEQGRQLHQRVKKPKHGGNGPEMIARSDRSPGLQGEGGSEAFRKPSGAVDSGLRDASSKEARRKNASSLGGINGNR